MSRNGTSRARYQGLAAARRWRHSPPRPSERFSLAVGDRTGDLTVIGHLACGRVSELYQVWSNEHWCALTGKLPAPGAPARSSERSLQHEADVLRDLRHPNIVRFFRYEAGHDTDRPHLLLEYLAGPSLFDLLEAMPKRRLHVPDAVRAVMHVGAAVHYLHRRGLLYRDLKPANILLREGVPVLVDFDVVVPLHALPGDRQGTAPYMAPEQVRGETLSPATDVYGLGVLLFELLTGKWPTEEPPEEDDDFWMEEEWDEDDLPEEPARARRAEEMTTSELNRHYPQLEHPPSPPRRHNPQVPPELERILLRSLAIDASQRFQTVSGFLAALAPLLKGPHRLWPENAPVERRIDTESR
jgi:eukaryotic-like serine/threonine-protein kinase